MTVYYSWGEVCSHSVHPVLGQVVNATTFRGDLPKRAKPVPFKPHIFTSPDILWHYAIPVECGFKHAVRVSTLILYNSVHDVQAAVSQWAAKILLEDNFATFMCGPDSWAMDGVAINDDLYENQVDQRVLAVYHQILQSFGLNYNQEKQCYSLLRGTYV